MAALKQQDQEQLGTPAAAPALHICREHVGQAGQQAWQAWQAARDPGPATELTAAESCCLLRPAGSLAGAVGRKLHIFVEWLPQTQAAGASAESGAARPLLTPICMHDCPSPAGAQRLRQWEGTAGTGVGRTWV